MTTYQVCELFNVTERQLQWWREHKLVNSYMDRHKHIYGIYEAIEVGLIKTLRDKGMHLSRVRLVLKRRGKSSNDFPYMVVRNKSVIGARDAQQVVQLGQDSNGPIYVVDVLAIQKNVEAAEAVYA